MVKKDARLHLLFLAYDIVLISFSFLLSMYVKYSSLTVGKYYVVLPIIILSWVVVATLFTEDNFHFRDSFFQRLKREFLEFLLFTGIISFTLLGLELKLYSRIMLFGTILGFFLLRNIGYLVLYRYLRYKRQQGRHVTNVLVLGAGRIGGRVLNFVTSKGNFGYNVIGFLDDAPGNPKIPDRMVLGGLNDLESIIESSTVDELVITLPMEAGDQIRSALQLADFHGLRVRLVPDYYRLFERNFKTSELGDLPVLNMRQIPLDNIFSAGLKRVFDTLFSLLVLILISPLLVTITVLVLLDSKGPVFYRPVRVGMGGSKFTCLKFRTMYSNENVADNCKSTVKGDDRITRIGAILRKFNLDELPQFINVLRNDMSVVGPRPHRTFLNDHMQQKVDGYMVRHYIKPGITGWAHVNDGRGPTETEQQRTERTKHDLWYIENWSFWLDLEIVIRTIFSRSSRENAF